MAHDEPYDDPNLTGFKRMFNNQTIRGRANYAKFWISFYGVLYLAHKWSKPKPIVAEEKSHKEDESLDPMDEEE